MWLRTVVFRSLTLCYISSPSELCVCADTIHPSIHLYRAFGYRISLYMNFSCLPSHRTFHAQYSNQCVWIQCKLVFSFILISGHTVVWTLHKINFLSSSHQTNSEQWIRYAWIFLMSFLAHRLLFSTVFFYFSSKTWWSHVEWTNVCYETRPEFSLTQNQQIAVRSFGCR